MPAPKSLKQRILRHIKDTGPMSVASYMSWCLLDPTQGYYPTRDPLGVDGDFITAPEISQMFGELLGLWLINTWRAMGSPKSIQLVEYGPGRGVMMSDMLRTARLDPDFFAALNINLIEPSAALEAKQGQILAACGAPINWAASLDGVPAGPIIVVGNEYLDCLPIRQFVMKDRFAGLGGFHERLVDIDPDNPERLIFTLAPSPISKVDQDLLPVVIPEFKNGDLLEVNMGLAQITQALKDRFAQNTGAALFIDYGPDITEFGDTFQALHKHKKVDPLADAGAADLTARVDFAHLHELGTAAGLSVYGPCQQGALLSRLGIEVRAVALAKTTKIQEQKSTIARQLRRLTDDEQMGVLFKAAVLQPTNLAAPVGFSA